MTVTMPLKWAAEINRSELAETTPDAFEFRYIDIGAVDSNGSVDVPLESISFATAPSRARRLTHSGATVVSTVRTYLRAIARVPADGLVFSTGFATLEARAQVDPSFLYYACRSDSFVEQVVARSTGVSYPAINPSDLGMIRIVLPRLDIQRRIADFLDDQVSRIDQTETLRERQAILLQQRRLSAYERCTDVPFSDIRLSRMLDLGAVGVVVNPSSYFEDEGVPFVHGYNVRDGWFDLSDLKRISDANSRRLSRSRLRLGDVLVMRAGFPGRSAVVTEELAGGNCASVLLLRTGPLLCPEYLSAFFNSPLGRAQVEASQYGAAQEVVNLGDVEAFTLPVPPVADQRSLMKALEAEINQIDALGLKVQESIVLLQERKRALITAAVTGEFDVTTASGRGVA